MQKYRRGPNVYISPSKILSMNDDDIIGVNHSVICAKLAAMYMSGSKDKEAMEVLIKANNEILEREKKCKNIVWGGKMTVKEVKIAFKDLEHMRRTSFKKII